MPITKTPNGGMVSTGYGVKLHSWLSQRAMVKLEQKGMGHSSGFSVTSNVIRILTGEESVRATAKQKKRALALIEAEIARLRPIVDKENRLGRCLTEQELILFEEDPQD